MEQHFGEAFSKNLTFLKILFVCQSFEHDHVLSISAPPDPGFHQPNYSDVEDELCLDWDEYDRQLALKESSEQVNACPFIDWEAEHSGNDSDDDSEVMHHNVPPSRNDKKFALVCYSESSEEERV